MNNLHELSVEWKKREICNVDIGSSNWEKQKNSRKHLVIVGKDIAQDEPEYLRSKRLPTDLEDLNH